VRRKGPGEGRRRTALEASWTVRRLWRVWIGAVLAREATRRAVMVGLGG